MRVRCEDPDSENYKRYGGRGIRVCRRWSRFENFIADMGPRPGSGYSIERKDNDGNYTPKNCVWATAKQQCNNRSTNRFIEFQGQRKTLTQWAELLGYSRQKLWQRFRAGWSVEKALT